MEKIEEILAKHFAGESSPSEEQELLQWKEKNAAEYDLLKQLWGEKSLNTQKIPEFNAQEAWKKVDQCLETPVKKLPLFRIVSTIAAALLLLLGVSYFFNDGGLIVVENTTASILVEKLPDGSMVSLTPGSKIEYASDFNTERSLTLEGEAFFEVERDENHPFVISHHFGEVEVLGTGFDVNVTENEAVVTVEHGLVALRNKNGDEVKIAANQSAAVSKYKLNPVHPANLNNIGWKTGYFEYQNTPINEVIEDLNKFYKKPIQLDASISPSDIPHLTATFDNKKQEEVIEIITLTCTLEAVEENNIIILK